jgi:hypothetical protein
MKALRHAIIARLVATPDVTSRLSTFMTKPAMFDRRPVPSMARPPYGAVTPPVTDEAYDTKTTTGRDILTDVFFFAEDTGDETLIDDLAEAAREALHRKPVAVTGYGNLVQSVSGPRDAPADGLYGRVLTVRTVMLRK